MILLSLTLYERKPILWTNQKTKFWLQRLRVSIDGSGWNTRIDKLVKKAKQKLGNTRTHLWNNRKTELKETIKLRNTQKCNFPIFLTKKKYFLILYVWNEFWNQFPTKNYNFGQFELFNSKIGDFSILKLSCSRTKILIRLFHCSDKIAKSIRVFHSVCQFGYFTFAFLPPSRIGPDPIL